jgi:hypothetical protein
MSAEPTYLEKVESYLVDEFHYELHRIMLETLWSDVRVGTWSDDLKFFECLDAEYQYLLSNRTKPLQVQMHVQNLNFSGQATINGLEKTFLESQLPSNRQKILLLHSLRLMLENRNQKHADLSLIVPAIRREIHQCLRLVFFYLKAISESNRLQDFIDKLDQFAWLEMNQVRLYLAGYLTSWLERQGVERTEVDDVSKLRSFSLTLTRWISYHPQQTPEPVHFEYGHVFNDWQKVRFFSSLHYEIDRLTTLVYLEGLAHSEGHTLDAVTDDHRAYQGEMGRKLMKVLLIYQCSPSQPHVFDWSNVVSILSASHEVRTAWWVVNDIDATKVSADLLKGLMLIEDVESFAPDIILFDGKPDPRHPTHGDRKLPWVLEDQLTQNGCAIVFLRAIPDINFVEANAGFGEYGFPICLSDNRRPVRLSGATNNPLIEITDWSPPHFLRNVPFEKIGILDEIVVASPWVLDDTLNVHGEALIYAPSHYDGKDSVWIHDDEIGGVRKPFVISAWKYYPGLIFLFTGDLFSDRMIGKGSNAILFQMLLKTIAVLQNKRLMLSSGGKMQPTSTGVLALGDVKRGTVFISHSFTDKKFVSRLAEDLTNRGIEVWVDEAEIKIGDSLIEKIRAGIDQVDFVAVVLSHASIESEWVKKEVDVAVNQEIAGRRVKVLPIMIEKLSQDEIPGFLLGKLYADFSSEDNYREALRKLLERLRS